MPPRRARRRRAIRLDVRRDRRDRRDRPSPARGTFPGRATGVPALPRARGGELLLASRLARGRARHPGRLRVAFWWLAARPMRANNKSIRRRPPPTPKIFCDLRETRAWFRFRYPIALVTHRPKPRLASRTVATMTSLTLASSALFPRAADLRARPLRRAPVTARVPSRTSTIFATRTKGSTTRSAERHDGESVSSSRADRSSP